MKIEMKFKVLMILAIAMVSLNSCDIEDDTNSIVNYQLLPVLEVEMPRQFVFGEIHTIPVIFEYTNTCESFAGFEVSSDLNERLVTVVASVTDDNCGEAIQRTQQDLRFLAASNGTYVFKFFTGLDANNEPTYLEYTIPVVE
ncbi:MAG: hypothetical protein ABF251_09255 [Nonlabens sp.]